MRLLLIDCGREMRGGQYQTLFLAEGLAARGHDAILLARAGSPLFIRAKEKGLAVETVGVATLFRLSASCDLVHAHDARAHSLAAAFSRAPLVVSRRVAFPVKRGLLSRWKYARARRYIAVSGFVRERLLEAGIDPTRIDVVYDGVPPAAQAPAGTRVLAPASDDPQKGSALLRSAAAAGGFAVEFAANLPEELQRGAAVFVYLTREEGLGSAILLAMMAGVPVIASRTGGIPEIVRDGETGTLVENSPAAVAAAVRHALSDRPSALAMAEKARERAARLFTVDAMVSATLSVYHRVLPC